MSKQLNLAFSIDKSYIQHFTVALISILENNRNLALNIFVIHDIEDQVLLSEIKVFFQVHYDNLINLIKIDISILNNFLITTQYPRSVYFRFLLSDILPHTIDTILYMDSDLVVTGQLDGLLELDMKNKFLYASEEFLTTNVSRLNSYGVQIRRYFNSGVLLINLSLWRSKSVSEGLIITAITYRSKLILPDQDVLNIYFANNWALLPMIYNSTDSILKNNVYLPPIVVHFTGGSKPWHYLNEHPYKNIYLNYLKISPFKQNKPKGYKYQLIFKKQIYWIKSSCHQLKAFFS